jgi:hypothetical protein
MSLTTGILQYGTGSHSTSSEEANGVATDFISQGVVGTISNTNGVAPCTGAFAVNAQASPNATVAVTAGYAYVTGTPTSQNSQTLRVRNTVSTNVTIAANSSGSTKYDWIYIKLDPTNMANPNAAADNVATFVTSRSSNASTDDGGSTPTYGYNIAVVTVANGFSTITNANITDKRSRSGATASGTTTATSSWNALGYTPSSVTALGNRSYSLLYSNVDLSATLSAGMRQQTTRTVAAPTKCTSLNGTTQYYSKSSPNKLTFTDDFVVSAWVKASSYAQGMIVSRYNGTSGWYIQMLATGQIQIAGLNAGAANNSTATSYQSIPLNKWVHITGQLDMSTFTATTTTSYIMIDGVDVPSTVARSGTNPTALIQAGNLEVGSWNGGLLPFAGKIAQVAIYNAKVTQATILASMNQKLAGTETSLASAYSFDGVITDLNTTTPNDLTANGSAVATSADSPFGGQADGTISSTLDYAEITSVAFSTNTTVVVKAPEGNTIPTSGGVSSVVYSSNAAPFGWPGGTSVLGQADLRASQTTTSTSLTDLLGLTSTVIVPTGARRIRIVLNTAAFQLSTSGSVSAAVLQDGTQIASKTVFIASGTGNESVDMNFIHPATSGSHTYKVQFSVNTGTGTAIATTTSPIIFTIEAAL